MTRDQRIVATGAIGGLAAMTASMLLLYRLLPADHSLTYLAARLGFALQANAVAAVPLLLVIFAVSQKRFFSEAIDPTRGTEGRSTDIDARVADNGVQQLVLFAVATCALSVNLASTEMRAISAAAIIFLVARIAFWIGYRIDPPYRAFGMAATSGLNLMLLSAALWRAAEHRFGAF